MRDFKGMKRQRGRNRKPGNSANNANPNRSWDSQGPENIKVRGNAQTVYERYMQLARDASSGGDRVLAENYLQHAEHYFRVLRALQPQRPASEIAQRELSSQGFDIDFEDESGAQAAAFLAAQQAAERAAQQAQQPAQASTEREASADVEPRSENGRNDGEAGNRRESRRERWERRRDERHRRPADEAGDDAAAVEGQAPVPEAAVETPVVEDASPSRGRRPRRERETIEAAAEEASVLPGFLTRPTRVSEPAEAASDETAPAPRRRSPRRKAEAVEE